MKQQTREREGWASAAGENGVVELDYFQILLCELRIYFNQTSGDCGRTNRDCFGEICPRQV